jgi:hypothetical protein
MLVKALLDLRNNYSRGSKDRHNPSLRTVQIVSETITSSIRSLPKKHGAYEDSYRQCHVT